MGEVIEGGAAAPVKEIVWPFFVLKAEKDQGIQVMALVNFVQDFNKRSKVWENEKSLKV